MNEIANIHRNETIGYVLSLVRGLHRTEADRVAFYATQPHAISLENIARDRSGRLEQLVQAIENGLFDQLDATAEDDARNERGYEAHEANEAWLDAHPDEFVDEEGETEHGYTGEQLNGNACSVCAGGFKTGDASQASGYVLGCGQLFAHTACLDESEAGR